MPWLLVFSPRRRPARSGPSAPWPRGALRGLRLPGGAWLLRAERPLLRAGRAAARGLSGAGGGREPRAPSPEPRAPSPSRPPGLQARGLPGSRARAAGCGACGACGRRRPGSGTWSSSPLCPAPQQGLLQGPLPRRARPHILSALPCRIPRCPGNAPGCPANSAQSSPTRLPVSSEAAPADSRGR